MGVAHTHYLVILTLKPCIKIVGRSADSLTAQLSCLTFSRSCQLSEIHKPVVPWHQVKIPVFTAQTTTRALLWDEIPGCYQVRPRVKLLRKPFAVRSHVHLRSASSCIQHLLLCLIEVQLKRLSLGMHVLFRRYKLSHMNYCMCEN